MSMMSMCFGEPEPLQGQIWADARRLSPRWNHCDWRNFSLIIYVFRLVGLVGFGGRFLRWGLLVPPCRLFPFPCSINCPCQSALVGMESPPSYHLDQKRPVASGYGEHGRNFSETDMVTKERVDQRPEVEMAPS